MGEVAHGNEGRGREEKCVESMCCRHVKKRRRGIQFGINNLIYHMLIMSFPFSASFHFW